MIPGLIGLLVPETEICPEIYDAALLKQRLIHLLRGKPVGKGEKQHIAHLGRFADAHILTDLVTDAAQISVGPTQGLTGIGYGGEDVKLCLAVTVQDPHQFLPGVACGSDNTDFDHHSSCMLLYKYTKNYDIYG
jgi:hypothetical protein